MASIGAKHPYVSKIKEEPQGSLPVYESAPVRLGRLIKADVSIQMASGKLYADDALAESVDEFVSAAIALETDDITDENASLIYGATVQEKVVCYNTGDTPPHLGFSYYKKILRGGKPIFKGFFYPKVKAALGNDTAQTKGDSITFGTSSTSLTVFACDTGDWRLTEEFDTEAAADAWCRAQLTPSGTEAEGGA